MLPGGESEFPEKSTRDSRLLWVGARGRVFTGLYWGQLNFSLSGPLSPTRCARMPFSNARSQSDLNLDSPIRCASVSEWFHRRGVVTWSGTPSELAGELLSAGVIGDGHASPANPAEVVSALEGNAEALRQQGVDVWVQRSRDRVKTITLRSNGAAPAVVSEEAERVVPKIENNDAVVNDHYDARTVDV